MKSKILMSCVLFTAIAIWSQQANAQQENEKQKTGMPGSLQVTTEWPDGTGHTQIQYVDEGRRYRIRLNGTRIMKLYVDEKEVPESEYANYEPLVKKILARIEEDREQAQKHRQQAERDREQAARDRAQAEEHQLQARKHHEQAERDHKDLNASREKAERDRTQAEQERKEAQNHRERAERDREKAMRNREQAEIHRAQADEDRKLVEALIDELVKEKLIENREALSTLELDEEVFIINGREQTKDLHDRFSKKYLKGKNDRIQFRISERSRNLSFD